MRSSNPDQDEARVREEFRKAIREALTRPLTEEELAEARRELALPPDNADEPEHFRAFLRPPSRRSAPQQD